MRKSILVATIAVLMTGSSAMAQQPQIPREDQARAASAAPVESGATLRERLRPPVAPAELAPRLSEAERAHLLPAAARAQPVAGGARGRSVAYMIAGGALFVAGLLVDGDAGTVMVIAGAGIGAYGLYLHFR